jgi:magnesium chelatase subunit I
MRTNLLDRLANGVPVARGLVGYEESVLPQIENALLAGHDLILLGERGQAKTRILRSLAELLDEWMPEVAGSEIHDDPYNPISRYARDLLAERGEETPINWVPREDRFIEKLATPDTTIADLIGEVDPIKVAEGRYLSDETTIHYGLVPRANRGIFAINELPDLSERIQVGLLNVLEERDVQVRGYRVRLPLDVLLVASANPEDYTNRGRIITPLKDRFGSQVRTHYPADPLQELQVVRQEALLPTGGEGLELIFPSFMAEIVAWLTHLARQSPKVNQRSGVSVRLTIANYETAAANACRRAAKLGESSAAVRISDLWALTASTANKIELDTWDDDEGPKVVQGLIGSAILSVFRQRLGQLSRDQLDEVVEAFDKGALARTGDMVQLRDYEELLATVPSLEAVSRQMCNEEDTVEPSVLASACELVLEGLHLQKRLNKSDQGPRGGTEFSGRISQRPGTGPQANKGHGGAKT